LPDIPGRSICICTSSPPWLVWSPIATIARSSPAPVAVALHHLALNFLLPAAIYPGGADLGRVVLHAVILLMEAGVLIWLSFKLSASVRGDRREDRRGRGGKRRRSPRQSRPHGNPNGRTKQDARRCAA
jgi:hypothetical protein